MRASEVQPPTATDVISYRKSGLSLNHVVGCPLECAYCIRHSFGTFDDKKPTALMSDESAIDALLAHPSFVPHKTPVQLFNRATDPFLPKTKAHLRSVLEGLDARGLTNHVLVITRWKITDADCVWMNELINLKLTVLLTYSAIDDPRLEPVDSALAARSLAVAFDAAKRYRVILYWRPLIPGVNDSARHIADASELSASAHATVFTGLFFKDEIAAYFKDSNLPAPYEESHRRKLLPRELESRILANFTGGPLFKKTSCAVAYAHGLPDYNGHFGLPELCDICPSEQRKICAGAHSRPSEKEFAAEVAQLDGRLIRMDDSVAIVRGLGEEARYLLQHRHSFQVHDIDKPHFPGRHGRASSGW